jgi:hypothetical protein
MTAQMTTANQNQDRGVSMQRHEDSEKSTPRLSQAHSQGKSQGHSQRGETVILIRGKKQKIQSRNDSSMKLEQLRPGKSEKTDNVPQNIYGSLRKRRIYTQHEDFNKSRPNSASKIGIGSGSIKREPIVKHKIILKLESPPSPTFNQTP